MASVPLFWASGHRFYGRGCDVGLAEPEAAALLVAACAWKYAWRPQSARPSRACV